MRVTIQANGFVLTEALRSYTEQRLGMALGWAGQHMRKLAVSLSDINGPRGGIDKRCKIQVQLGGGKEVIIEDTEADLYVAIDRAADRADRAVVRQVERKRDFAHTRLPAAVSAEEETSGDDAGERRDDAAR
ncbi:HPF/RaiA family ribosome-associated protein [Massilia atriviolacea]|uniref:HPF/RaiA family ribosome-associated protein n=1 Tax=Massilia atriviolacea TaxID=2495579 RepID=A0A430HCR3_9BURK|nr:HPF/RaiA family ribosome-associated protein [Massilia atriviolacea]RSZ55318.1 HPF/RaiA family ribosome-associated protein [Massilia atriviolacea]